jgi:hypothetical protein
MVKTTVRDLVRDFGSVRQRADAGEVVRIKGRTGLYIFKAEGQKGHGLVGCCAGLAPRKGAKPGPVESPDVWIANR